MKTPKSLYSRLALATSVTLVMGYVLVYAWYAIPDVNTGDTLSKDLINHMLSNITELKTSVDSKISSQWNTSGSDINYTAGKVGIGTATPAASLDIKRTAADSQFAGWIEGSDVNNYGLGVNIANTTSAKAIADFKSGNTSRLFVRADGNVGIGTSSPGARLHINRNSGDTGAMLEVGTGSPAQIGFVDIIANHGGAAFQVWDDNNLTTPKFIVQRDGNVGIGTATPTYKFSLAQGVGVITSSATVNDYYLPVTTGGAKLGVPDNVVTPLFKSGYDTVFTLHIVAKEPGTNSMLSKTYAVSILYGSPLITQIQSNSFSTTITSLNIAYDNPTRTIRATIDTTGGQSTNVYWSINGIGALTEGKFEIQ